MNYNYLYLMINVGTILFPFLFSFEKKVAFYKSWKYIFPAILLTAVPFIIFDNYYTSRGIWGFNQEYVLGINIFNLPLEEILFFFTIPYACLFIYVGLNKVFPSNGFFDSYKNIISIGMMILCLILGIIFLNRAYTSVICVAVVVFLAIHTFILKSNYMGRFWRFFTVQLVPFIIVNGILTGLLGKSVFWYNEDSIISFRILTIPVEDLFFSLAMMLMNISLYEYFINLSFTKIKKLSWT